MLLQLVHSLQKRFFEIYSMNLREHYYRPKAVRQFVRQFRLGIWDISVTRLRDNEFG
jgi:hypothetical protein